MRILLVQNSVYYPSRGGANKANRLLLEALARRGHDCFALAVRDRGQALEPVRAGASALGLRDPLPALSYQCQGVPVCAYRNSTELGHDLSLQLRRFQPDCVLVSSEDPFQVLLRATLQRAAAPIVYLSHTLLLLPFGPGAMAQNEVGADAIRKCSGVISFSHFCQNYLAQWGGIRSTLMRIPWFGEPPFADLRCNPGPYTLMVNPCAVKGLKIFLALAERLPHVPFAVIPTWGTTADDRSMLEDLPNVSILEPVDNLEAALRNARVLLVPSLWLEGFGVAATEAMLRGIPVIASNVGGLPEAKLGIEYVLPVQPISRYSKELDAQYMPKPIVPEQRIDEWSSALSRLLGDQQHWHDIASRSRAAALAFAKQCEISVLEDYLASLDT